MKKSAIALSFLVCLGAAPAPTVPNYAALCSGWEGRWRALDAVVRQADGSWKSDMADPGWRVRVSGPGKCGLYGDPDNGSWFTIDTTHGRYDVQNFDKGRAGPVVPYRFLRSEIVDARTWQVEVLAPPEPSHPSFVRLHMTMAGDSFAITFAKAPTAAGPFQLQTYAVHRRQPS